MNPGTDQPQDDKAQRLARAFDELRSGQEEQARAVFADLMHDPRHGVEAHRGLAAVAWKRQESDTAIQLLRMAVQQQPDHADAQADLGLVLLLSGRAKDSLAHWDKRLRLRPTDAPAWHNYGKALAAAGYPDESVRAYEQALELAPDQAPTYENYARSLMAAGEHERAETVWRRGIEKLPGQASLYQGLVEAQFARGRLQDCMETYRAGLTAQPDSPELHLGLGQILDDLRDRAGAEAAFRRALELRPGWALPIEGLLTLLRKDARDEDLAAARAVLDDPLRPPQDHANAGYGLGKALEARGADDEAFAAWSRANAARRTQIGPFNRAAMTKRVDRFIAQFSAPFLEARRAWGHSSDRPVFVLGMPRSGTTLVEQILAAHPAVYGYGELSDLARIAKDLPKRARSIQRWPEAAAALRPETVRAAADEYLASLQKHHATTAAKLVDKAPTNFFHIGLIALLFPKARIIWCRRDPRDICLSIYSENFGLDQRHATDLSDLGFYYREYLRLMRHWHQVAGAQIHSCRYEDLVADPERHSRELIAAVGLPWDDRCLQFHESDRAVLTPSRWQVRSPIYTASVGRWQRYERHLAPLLESLGDASDG